MKYSDPALAARYSGAPDYPAVARHALDRMVADTGAPVYDEDGMMLRGVIVRVLLLPGQVEDAKETVRYVWERYGEKVVLSLMDQYTPPSEGIPGFPENLREELLHCILSHHGELEYGSPKKPALIEAVALSFADNIDAKMEHFTEILSSSEGINGWLGFDKIMDSNIRRTVL